MTNIAIAIVSCFAYGKDHSLRDNCPSTSHSSLLETPSNIHNLCLFHPMPCSPFISPVVLNLLELRYQGKAVTPFDTHPKTMSFGIACFLAYCLIYDFELKCYVTQLPPTHAPTLRSSMVVFGSLSLVSFLSILFSDSIQPILFRLYALLLMAFLLTFMMYVR